jgi:hypothetical protein
MPKSFSRRTRLESLMTVGVDFSTETTDANHEVCPCSHALVLVTTLARAAGMKAIEVPADSVGPALRAFVWSPCATPAADIRVG